MLLFDDDVDAVIPAVLVPLLKFEGSATANEISRAQPF